jgi:hypothetical protein
MVLGDISMMVFPPKNISVIMKGVQEVVGLVCTTLQHTQRTDQHVLLHRTCLQMQCADNTIP